MTNQNNPIDQIKKAEEQSKKKIHEKAQNFDEKLKIFEEELEKKTLEFENNLREKGQAKLETVKKEAGELFKTKMATAESGKNKILAEAKGKQPKAVDEIISSFLKHIKK